MSVKLDDIPALKTVLTPVVYRMVKEKCDNRLWIVTYKDYYGTMLIKERILSIHKTEEDAKQAYIYCIKTYIFRNFLYGGEIKNEFKKCEDKLLFIYKYRRKFTEIDKYAYYEFRF